MAHVTASGGMAARRDVQAIMGGHLLLIQACHRPGSASLQLARTAVRKGVDVSRQSGRKTCLALCP